MERPAGWNRDLESRPRRASLVVRAVVALATIGTSPGQPSVEAVTGSELAIDGARPVTRDLHIHIADTRPSTLTTARLRVSLRTVGDVSYTHSDAIQIAIEPIDDKPSADPEIPTVPSWDIGLPVADCADGCDLAYRLAFTPHRDVGIGAVIRFEAAVRLGYDSGSGRPPERALTMTLDGDRVPPVGLTWILVAAVAGLVGGTRLGRRYRQPTTLGLVPVVALAAVLALGAVWPFAGRGDASEMLFTAALLLAHAVWLAFGIRRWRIGESWLLGLAAFSTVALCGLWLAWIVALLPILPRLELALIVGMLGVIAGTVLGQTWDRREVRPGSRTVLATAVVVSQGLLIAGLTHVSLSLLVATSGSGSTPNPLGIVPLGTAVVVGWGAFRWFAGAGGFMFVVNLLVLAIGLLGSFLWFSAQAGLFGDPGIDPLDLMILIEVVAAVVGVFAARRPPHPPTMLSLAIGDAPAA